MSLPVTNIRCQGCNFEGTFFHNPVILIYKLPEGEAVECGRNYGWCRHCDGIRDIEPPFDRVVIRKELEDLEGLKERGGFFGRWFRPKPDESKRAHLRTLLKLAELRTSTSRCLTCGHDVGIPLQFNGLGVVVNYIHTCGGRLYRLPTPFNAARESFGSEEIHLDVEGRRVVTGTAATAGKAS